MEMAQGGNFGGKGNGSGSVLLWKPGYVFVYLSPVNSLSYQAVLTHTHTRAANLVAAESWLLVTWGPLAPCQLTTRCFRRGLQQGGGHRDVRSQRWGLVIPWKKLVVGRLSLARLQRHSFRT